MNAEFKRMMELAGLAEIKVNEPTPPSIHSRIKRLGQELKSLVINADNSKKRSEIAITIANLVLRVIPEKYDTFIKTTSTKIVQELNAYLEDPTEERKNSILSLIKGLERKGYTHEGHYDFDGNYSWSTPDLAISAIYNAAQSIFSDNISSNFAPDKAYKLALQASIKI